MQENSASRCVSLIVLGLGETVVGGVEVVVNGVGVGAVLNGNKVVVGGGEVCDACVVAALSGGTEHFLLFKHCV